MSDTNLERLVASLELRTDNFEKSLAKIRAQSSKHTAEMAGDFHKLTEAVIETGKRVGETFGLTLGAAALYEAPKQIMEIVKSVGELKTAAEKAGVSIEELQKLNFATIGTGLGQDQLVEMMGQFNKRIGEAATKGGDLKKLLDANGVSLRNSNGEIRSASDLLGDIADLVKNTRSDQEATVIATMAFGKAGADVLSFLRQGKDEINAQKQAAQELGAVIGADIVNKADEFDKRWSQSWATWKAEGKAAISELALGYLDWADKQMQPSAGFTPGRTVNGQFVPADQTGLIHPFDAGRVDLPGGLGPRTVVPGPMFGPNPAPANWKSAYDQQVEGLQKHIAAIQAETAAYGQSAGAIARAKAEADALAAIKAKDGVVTDAEVEGLKKYLDQLQKVTDAQEEAAKRQKAMADASQELTSGAQDFVHTLIEGGDALKSLQSTLLKILESIIDANLFGSGPFAGIFGTQGQNGMPGGVLGNLIASAFHPGASNSTAPAALAPIIAKTSGQVFGPFLPQGSITSGPLSAKSISGIPYSDTISAAAAKYNLDPSLLAGLIKHESGFQPGISSPAGAMGLTQLMPGTARQLGVSNAFDPTQNVYGGANYLRQMLDRYGGNTQNALRAYNWGPGNMDRFLAHGGSMPLETQNYPGQVMAAQQQIAQSASTFSTSFDSSLKTIPAATTAAGGNFVASFSSALQTILNGLGGSGGGLGNIGSFLSPLLGGGGKHAGGGRISGPGSSTSDSIPAWLSSGEFVVNADAAKRFGPLLDAINDNRVGSAPSIPRLPAMNFPAARTAAGSDKGGGHIVNIHNYAGVDVSSKASHSTDGYPQIDIAIRDMEKRIQKKFALQEPLRRRG